MKKETLLLAIIYLLLAGPFASPESRLILGGSAGFSSLALMQGLTLDAGVEAPAQLLLRDRQPSAEDDTDLLISFDTEPFTDQKARYRISNPGNGVQLSRGHKARGVAAGAFRRGTRLIVSPREDGTSLFEAGLSWEDFSIEFWLYPTSLEEGESILSWRGAGPDPGNGTVQEFFCRIEAKTLVWRFSQIFRSEEGSGENIELRGSTPLVPRIWRHHALRYEAATGLLEYSIDGIPEDIRYATSSGREEGRRFQPRLGSLGGGPLIIGEGLTGFLDELRINRNAREFFEPRAYSAEGGRAETLPVDLGYGGSRLSRIDARYRIPSNGAIFFFYQIAEDLDELSRQEWIPFSPGRALSPEVRGRFVRFRIDMYPDGPQVATPRLIELSIDFETRRPPPAPAFVAAFPGDGSVELHWSAVPDPDLQGYLIYYGSRPGVYDGKEKESGPSPIRVGKISRLKLPGMENGKLYYFALSSYDGRGDARSSPLSREVSARPSRLYRNEDEAKN